MPARLQSPSTSSLSLHPTPAAVSGNLWVHRDVYAKAYKKLPKNHRH